MLEEVDPDEIANACYPYVLLIAVDLGLDGGSDVAATLERFIYGYPDEERDRRHPGFEVWPSRPEGGRAGSNTRLRQWRPPALGVAVAEVFVHRFRRRSARGDGVPC